MLKSSVGGRRPIAVSVAYVTRHALAVEGPIREYYLVGPTDLIARIVKIATNTYISPNMVSQAIVYNFCTSGALDRSIETVKAALRERAQTLCEALRASCCNTGSSM